MTDPQRFSRTHSDIFGLFKAELARAGAITGFLDAGASLWPRFAACYEDVARLPRKARRALQRRWRRSLAGIALLHALGQVPAALAAQIDVGVGGCTLVDAITAANADQPTGGCTTGSGVDTITLPAGSTQTLTSENNYSGGYNGVPVITSAIVIQGNGSTIRRASSAPQFRIVAVESTGDLTLQDTTLSGGAAAGDGARPGGGVFNDGALTLINSTVSGNSAGTYGGGVSNTGTMTLTNSTVSGNSARYGGGVLSAGTLTVTNSTVSDNSAFSDGGGVFTSGTLTLDQSLVSGNSASSQGPEVFNSVFQTFPGTVITNGFNLFGYDGSAGVAGFTPGVTDIVPAVPLSAILDSTLADNDGSTRTHALVTGSPAIDAIPAASCVTTGDQRDVTRPQDGDEDTNADCDIGAFELQLPTSPPPPPPPLPSLPLPPEATPAEPNPQLRCTGSACRVLIKCDAVQGSLEPCNIRVDVFVRASALRVEEGGATRARRRIRFAAAVANVPAGGTANVRLRLTKRGQQIVRANEHRRLRGVMEIRNSVGPVQAVRVRIRLR
jgi:hypothetical protein